MLRGFELYMILDLHGESLVSTKQVDVVLLIMIDSV